jgi:hypothetical protein
LEKPVPFWHVKSTDVEEDANMELIKVAVAVGVPAGIRGRFKGQGVGIMLDSYINPEATVTVILPVFVNSSRLEFGDKLVFYKKPEATEEKKTEGRRRGRCPRRLGKAAC